MRTAKSSSKLSAAIVLAWCLGGCGYALAGAMPETENGRYALSPAGDGMLRLDTRTGAISTCSNSGAGWACYTVPDERAAMDTEIGRLQADNEKLKADNERLKADLASREPTVPGKIEEPLPKSDSLKKSERRWRRANARSKFRCRATATWIA
jgi:hypothetical protein